MTTFRLYRYFRATGFTRIAALREARRLMRRYE